MPDYSFKNKMDCGGNLVKYLLFVFNFIFWVFSIAVLVLGIIYKLKVDVVEKYLGDEFPATPSLFISIGVLAFVVSFFGCFGAWKENRCALLTFVCLLIALLLIELGAVIIAFIAVTNDKMQTNIKQTMYNNLCSGDLKPMERTLECCGVLGPEDYFGNSTVLPLGCGIPDSCYKDQYVAPSNLYSSGCYEKLRDSYIQIGSEFGAVGLTVAVVQVFSILLVIKKYELKEFEYAVAMQREVAREAS